MKKILLIILATVLFCNQSRKTDILEHINNINTPQALLNASKFRAEDYYSNKKNIEFARAVEVSDRVKIDKLLNDGVDINFIGDDSISFLCWAFIKFQRNSFKYLLEKRANPNLHLIGGNTIIDFAKKQNETFYLDKINLNPPAENK